MMNGDGHKRLTIGEVNSLASEQFVSMFGNAVELCGEAALRVGDKRPFANVWQLCEAFAHYLDSRPEYERVQILCSHPELAARAQPSLTAESTSEQRAAGLDAVSQADLQLIQSYNSRYREKFGFPFIICARENKVKAIIEGLTRRFENDRASEIVTAIDEVKKICRLRILDIVN